MPRATLRRPSRRITSHARTHGSALHPFAEASGPASSTGAGHAAADGVAATECYAAAADLTRLHVGEQRRAQLERLIAQGRALARGRLVRGLVTGFPELDTFVVSEVWVASSSQGEPTGSVRRLRRNGIVCVTFPCHTIHAAELNSARHLDVTRVDLSRTGAPARERQRALGRIEKTTGLLAAGRVVRRPNAGPAGASRTFVATQFYTRQK